MASASFTFYREMRLRPEPVTRNAFWSNDCGESSLIDKRFCTAYSGGFGVNPKPTVKSGWEKEGACYVNDLRHSSVRCSFFLDDTDRGLF
jgi:hypothetical protein